VGVELSSVMTVDEAEIEVEAEAERIESGDAYYQFTGRLRITATYLSTLRYISSNSSQALQRILQLIPNTLNYSHLYPNFFPLLHFSLLSGTGYIDSIWIEEMISQ